MKLVVPDISSAEALRQLRAAGYPINGLLSSPESNPKVAKNSKLGVLTSPLHLAPHKLSGYNVCPKATDGCSAACLHTAGHPAYMLHKERSRLFRTKAYFEQRPLFMRVLIGDILSLMKRAAKDNMQPGVRLNATSDIPWERVSFDYKGVNYSNIMEMFDTVDFYDYTKRYNRINLPANYTLTFSLAENNDEDAVRALDNGHNVAAVFDTKRGQPLPAKMFLGGSIYRVIDGDEHDYRPADPKGVVVGLRAKGDAIGDTSGFVRPASLHISQEFDPPSVDTRQYDVLDDFDRYWEETCV